MLGGVFLLGVGGKLDEELFWQFDSLVMLKTGCVIKLWWGEGRGVRRGGGEGILLVWKIIEFLATVGDHNPPVGKILTYPLKNHNLLFIIKHFEHKFQKKYSCEQFSGNLSMMV